MARFKLYLEQGSSRSDIDDLIDQYSGDIIDECEKTVVVEVRDCDAEAFSDDAENDFNVNCIDEVK